jgi:hypothetical protein
MFPGLSEEVQSKGYVEPARQSTRSTVELSLYGSAPLDAVATQKMSSGRASGRSKGHAGHQIFTVGRNWSFPRARPWGIRSPHPFRRSRMQCGPRHGGDLGPGHLKGWWPYLRQEWITKRRRQAHSYHVSNSGTLMPIRGLADAMESLSAAASSGECSSNIVADFGQSISER